MTLLTQSRHIITRARKPRVFQSFTFLLFLTIAAVFVFSGFSATQSSAQQSYLPQSYVPIQGQGFENIRQGTHAGPMAGTQTYDPSMMQPSPRPFVTDRFATLSVSERQMRSMVETMAGDDLDYPLSLLEKAYSYRIVDPVRQFGYDLFKSKESDLKIRRNLRRDPMTALGPVPFNPYSGSHYYQSPSANRLAQSYDQEYSRGYQDAVQDKNRATYRQGIPGGAVQDDFTLSAGDRLEIIFRGQQNIRGLYTINSEGILIVEDLPPVNAAGRPFGQIKELLQVHASQRHNTELYVSLDMVRQIDVLVVGHVEKPGRQILTVFHSALDALIEAGGVQKTGSLRQIKLIRNGRSTHIDLYALLMHGSTTMDFTLRDGDRIVVPPIGPTVAVTGHVKRPAIYELRPDRTKDQTALYNHSEALSMNELVDMAGGLISPGKNRYIRLSLTNDGRETVEQIPVKYTTRIVPKFGDGDILKITPSEEIRTGTIELTGHTRTPGLHDIRKVDSLSKLLPDSSVLGENIYPLIGAIERWDRDHMAPRYLSFPPIMVIKGQFDRKLQDGDIVHLFSRDQILNLQSDPLINQDIARSSNIPGTMQNGLGGNPSQNSFQNNYPASHSHGTAFNRLTPASGQHHNTVSRIEYGSSGYHNEDMILRDPVLISFLTERSVFIRGAVRRSGAYPITGGVNLKNVIAVAGGLTLEANTNNIEVTSALHHAENTGTGQAGTERLSINFAQTNPETVILEPGDTIRVNQKFKKISDTSVQIMGEVQNPGRYDLLPGDTLSDLLDRAGGLSAQAYPKGAIFSRASARRAEEIRFRNAAQELRRSVAVAMNNPDDPPTHMQVAMTHDLIAQLNQVEAVGRITVESNPDILAANPQLDILLETGDRIFIPKRPLTVRVTGEVLSAAVLQFRDNKDARDYIAEAGGYSFHADKKRSFVVYPDGSAEPLMLNVWSHNAIKIPPGSTVVVPRDPKPFDFMESAKDFSQILSNLAITGIFLEDIRDD